MEIQAIDTMNRPFYVSNKAAKNMFEMLEMRIAGSTTLAGVARKRGIKPGEEWRLLAGHDSVKDLVAEMDAIGVQYSFMDPVIQWSYRDSKATTAATIEEIAEFVKQSNGRIIGGAGYNPFRIKESLETIETAVKKYGFKYIWFHPMTFGLRPDDRKCYPLYAKCIELGIACTYQSGHSAEPLPSEPGHPYYADRVALDFPELTLVLTHTGWPWIDEWMSMLWRHPNVYGNIGAYFPSSLKKATVEFMDSGPGRNKVLWGSNGFGLTRCKKEFLELPISDETKRKVLRENAIKVFKLA